MNNFSSQHHSFDISLAKQFGMEEAILIHHFQHWIRINKTLRKNQIEGRTWTYQTYNEIFAHFPYLSYEKVRYALRTLVKNKILIKGNFNKRKGDNTLWFAFENEEQFVPNKICSNNLNYEGMGNFTGVCENSQGSVKIPTALPDTKTDTIKEKREEAKPPTPSLFIFNRVKIDKEKFEKLNHDFGVSKIKEMIDRLDEYAEINPKKFNQYASHAAVIRKWIREDQEKSTEKANNQLSHDQASKDKALAKKIAFKAKKAVSLRHIVLGYNYIEFHRGHVVERVNFGENGFLQRCENQLRKMNINTDFLNETL